MFRFPLRFKVLDLSVLCFLLNFIYDLTRKISVGLFIFICLNILSKMLNIKQYNNPNAAVGFYNELYTDDFISLCRTSQQLCSFTLSTHAHPHHSNSCCKIFYQRFISPPPFLMTFKDTSPYHVYVKYLFEIFSVNNCL